MSKDLHGQIPVMQESAVSNIHIIFQSVPVEKFKCVIFQQILQKSNFFLACGYFLFTVDSISSSSVGEG